MSLDLENTTVAQLALSHPAIVPVLEQWRIDYCCRGKAPLAEALEGAGIEPVQLLGALAELSAGTDTEPRPEHLGPAELADYIIARHHEWTRAALDRLAPLARRVAEVHGKRAPRLVLVRQRIDRLHVELEGHMLREEQILFPFIRQLHDARVNGTRSPIPFFGTVRNPIQRMMEEHEVAGEILEEMIPILEEETEDPRACTTLRLLGSSALELERDLHAHVHLENNVLFPRAISDEDAAGEVDENLEDCSSTGCCGGHA